MTERMEVSLRLEVAWSFARRAPSSLTVLHTTQSVFGSTVSAVASFVFCESSPKEEDYKIDDEQQNCDGWSIFIHRISLCSEM